VTVNASVPWNELGNEFELRESTSEGTVFSRRRLRGLAEGRGTRALVVRPSPQSALGRHQGAGVCLATFSVGLVICLIYTASAAYPLIASLVDHCYGFLGKSMGKSFKIEGAFAQRTGLEKC
jgi:hypothetical protein